MFHVTTKSLHGNDHRLCSAHCLRRRPKSEEVQQKWDQSLRVTRYETSAISTGIRHKKRSHSTMDMMPSLLARRENFAAVSGSSVCSASTELISALIPMQENPQTMLHTASFLWCSSWQQDARPCPAARWQVSVSADPGVVFSGLLSIAMDVWGE